MNVVETVIQKVRGIEMTRTKLGLLGLCAIVTGLMAFSTSSAQAVPEWLFAEKAPNSGLIPFLLASFNIEADSPLLELHSEILKIKVLFLCTEISAVNAFLGPNGTIEPGISFLFGGCEVDLNGTKSPECKPSSGGVAGVIKTNKLDGVIDLHKLEPSGVRDDVVRLLAEAGETLATIELPASCPIGAKVPLLGKLVFKDCQGLFLTHLVEHLMEADLSTEIWTISKTAEHVAALLGSMWAFLTGKHENLKFSGDPA